MKSKKEPEPHIQTVIAELKIGREETLRKYYSSYRDQFVCWMRKHDNDDHGAKTAYQDAMVRFFEKAIAPRGNKEKSENLDDYDCLFKTCLFAFGRFYFLKRHRPIGRLKVIYSENIEEQKSFDQILSELLETELEQQFQIDQMLASVEQLGASCKKILYLFYFEKLKIPDITRIYSYANDATVRVTKARCLAQLKQLLYGK